MSKYAENHEEMLLYKLRRYIDTEEYKYEAPYITKGDVEVIIPALEKQMPKKVNLRHIRKYDGFDDGECPNCGMSVSREYDGNDVFCPDCGQKLDWSDTD